MLQVIWTTEALDQLDGIAAYIGMRNPAAALRLQATIERTAESLPNYPYMYRPGRVFGTREALVHPNYFLVYQVGEDAIVILGVLHARQNYP